MRNIYILYYIVLGFVDSARDSWLYGHQVACHGRRLFLRQKSLSFSQAHQNRVSTESYGILHNHVVFHLFRVRLLAVLSDVRRQEHTELKAVGRALYLNANLKFKFLNQPRKRSGEKQIMTV